MLSKRLKVFRERCGLTQKQIADVLNLDRSTYSYYEIGKSYPTIETLIKLARIFQITMDELVDFKKPAESTLAFTDNLPSYNTGAAEQDYAEKINMLSKDEQNLLVGYRILSESSKREIKKLATELARNSPER